MMQSKNIEKILIQKAASKTLHNLYLIEPNDVDSESLTNEWVQKLTHKMVSENLVNSKSLINHPDVLILKCAEDAKSYSMQDIDQVFTFMHYKAQEYHRKFLIIEDAKLLSEIHINKLLKTFEEPPIDMSIFLINPSRQQLIPTLYSRSIQLRIPLFKKSREPKVQIDLTSFSFHDFTQYIHKNQLKFDDLIEYLLNQLNELNINYQTAQKVQTILQELELDKTFHGSKQTQLLKVHTCLQIISRDE